MHIDYKTKNVCSRKISFDIEDNIVKNIVFTGGCDGNLKALSKILDGAKAEDIIEKLSGNDCMGKGTSCADQLAKAVKKAIEYGNEGTVKKLVFCIPFCLKIG